MREGLQVKLKEYMKQKDRVRADTVRSIISAFQYEEMAKKVAALDKDSAIAILQRELKKRKEELEFVEKSGRPELIEKNRIEIKHFLFFVSIQIHFNWRMIFSPNWYKRNQ